MATNNGIIRLSNLARYDENIKNYIANSIKDITTSHPNTMDENIIIVEDMRDWPLNFRSIEIPVIKSISRDKYGHVTDYSFEKIKIPSNTATTSASGLMPILEGGTTKFLRADGTWAVPPDTNTTYSDATTSASGLMTAAMVTKLNGIAEGATKVTIDSALSTTSTNPVQNAIVSTEINNILTQINNALTAM